MIDDAYVRELIERETVEMLVPVSRDLVRANGMIERVTLYEVVWRWFDRIQHWRAKHPHSELCLLSEAEEHAGKTGSSFEDALAFHVALSAQAAENVGVNLLDADELVLALRMARQATARWRAKKPA